MLLHSLRRELLREAARAIGKRGWGLVVILVLSVSYCVGITEQPFPCYAYKLVLSSLCYILLVHVALVIPSKRTMSRRRCRKLAVAYQVEDVVAAHSKEALITSS